MKRIVALACIVVVCTASSALALYSVSDRGEWPKSWPKELEGLRKQATTFVGPQVDNQHFAIPFTKQEEFEQAWPHILKVKTPGAPIILIRKPNFFLGDKAKTGVVVHAPPAGQADNPKTPATPIASDNVHIRYMNMTYIEVVVDGEVIDLNRIALPPDTPIVDERFEKP